MGSDRLDRTIEAHITELSAEWYALIGADHHKHRDCHFYIEKKWSYGQPPVSTVQHDGYVWDSIDKEFPTSREAHEFLERKLKQMIASEKQNENIERSSPRGTVE